MQMYNVNPLRVRVYIFLTGTAVRRRAGLRKSRTGQPRARINGSPAFAHLWTGAVPLAPPANYTARTTLIRVQTHTNARLYTYNARINGTSGKILAWRRKMPVERYTGVVEAVYKGIIGSSWRASLLHAAVSAFNRARPPLFRQLFAVPYQRHRRRHTVPTLTLRILTNERVNTVTVFTAETRHKIGAVRTTVR